MKSAIKTLWNLFQAALIVLLVLILAGSLYMKFTNSPSVLGWSWLEILSGSMEPEIGLDDLIVNKAQDSYQVGDIITYQNGSSLTTHRIVGEAENGFITKGDANNTVDTTPVTRDRIVGKVVFTIPRAGLVLGWLRTPMGMLCMVLTGLCFLEIPYLLEKRKS